MKTLKVGVFSREIGALGGDTSAANNFILALDALGCSVTALRADLSDFRDDLDIYHIYAAVGVSWAFPLSFELFRKQKVFTITPLYFPRDERMRFYHGLDDVYPGYKETIAQILQWSSALACLTMGELRACWDLIGDYHRGFIMGVGCGALPALKDEEINRGDYVVSVGRIEKHKNQSQLALACASLGIPLVCVGDYNVDSAYSQQLRSMGVQLTGELDHRKTCALIAGARVAALPSFGEIVALSNQEAAYYGTPLVIGLGHDWEYFGDRAEYCDPTDFRDIARALVRAWNKERSPWTSQPGWKGAAMRYLAKIKEFDLIWSLRNGED